MAEGAETRPAVPVLFLPPPSSQLYGVPARPEPALMAAEEDPWVLEHILVAVPVQGLLESSLSALEAAGWGPCVQQSFDAEGALGLRESCVLG